MNLKLPTAVVCITLFSGGAFAEENKILEIVKANFEAADMDGNGSLDKKEFPSLIDANAEHNIGRAKMAKRFGAYDRAFKTADKDGDGAVTWSELMSNQQR